MSLLSLFVINSKKRLLLVSAIIFWIAVVSSCAPVKETPYFSTLKKDTVLTGFIPNIYESKIQKKDILAIKVSSLSAEMDLEFNTAASALSDIPPLNVSNSGKGFMVDEKGNINLHYLGAVHVEGKTRRELQLSLEKELLPYMKEPIVGVQYLNHKITVLGYVGKPQVIELSGEQMPLLDVLVRSGDVRDNGLKKRVMVIRENGTEKEVKYVSLEDNSIFTSPWYYVRANDIVYVFPDNTRRDNEERRRTLQTTLSMVATFTSLVILIINTAFQ